MMRKVILTFLFFMVIPMMTAFSQEKTGAAQSNTLQVFMQPADYKGSSVPYGNNPEHGRYAESEGAKIYFETYGTGEPLLVLHGGMVGCTYEMGQFIDHLSKQFQVIAVSTRGHGKSEIGHTPVTYEQRAKDALAALNAAAPNKPAIVLGFSGGAYSAYKLASMFPDRVKKLVAIGAGENLRLLRVVPRSKVEEVEKIDPAFMKLQESLMPEPARLQSYWDELYVFYNDRMIADKKLFNNIKCPTLLISGELDTHAPLDTVISAYKMIPESRLAIIQGAPHQVMVTNFPAVWENIKGFLELANDTKIGQRSSE